MSVKQYGISACTYKSQLRMDYNIFNMSFANSFSSIRHCSSFLVISGSWDWVLVEELLDLDFYILKESETWRQIL